MPADDLVLRPLTPDDFDDLWDLVEIVFHSGPVPPGEREFNRELMVPDLARGIGVFDGADLAGVGTMRALELSVPGGMLPMGAVTLIAVNPACRRRGIMSRVARHQLNAVHERGEEPVAGLTASESAIYGRFGYAQATYGASFTIPRDRSALRPVPGAEQVRVRMVPTAGSVAACEAVMARQAGQRPGMLVRPESWGRAAAMDFDSSRGGRSSLRTVLAERGGEVAGYARYRTKNEYASNDVAVGYTDVSEIMADDAAALSALLRYLLGIDLTGGVTLHHQPVDSPLVHLLADLRAAGMRVRENLYLRLVDVDRALAARGYAVPVDLVIEVADELCPWNAGRWRLAGDEKSAECVRTDAPPDLSLDVRELGAVYLGGTTLAALEQAALVTERRPGAVAEASRAFATQLAPWLQFGI